MTEQIAMGLGSKAQASLTMSHLTTADAIEGMTDAGQFEILAMRTLRELDPDCRSVIHCGVNALGKTIPSPIDGFCQVAGSVPPRYVMVCFSTTASEGVASKWLFDHTKVVATKRRRSSALTAADDGDLIKAGREAEGIRALHPGATFKVCLCTNRRIGYHEQKDAQIYASQIGVAVDFLEQSRLRDFLDVTPMGQWLRQEHLGILADQLSKPLLQVVSRGSLERYSSELLLPPQDELVTTHAIQDAVENLGESPPLVLLVGQSGAGKSVVAHEVLRHHLENGGIGIWLPAEIAAAADSLPSAIGSILKSLHPRLGAGCGHDVLNLATQKDPLLIVLDDLCRNPSPEGLLRKLVGWLRPSSKSDLQDAPRDVSVRFYCPIWNSIWNPVARTYQSMSWIRASDIRLMVRNESVDCLKKSLGDRAQDISDLKLAECAEHLNDDPILLGLFAQLFKASPEVDPLSLTDNVIGRMTERASGELARTHRLHVADYSDALNRLSIELIRRKQLYPIWRSAQTWFLSEPHIRDRLAELVAQGDICRLGESLDEHRVYFRHDRVQEYHLASAAYTILQQTDTDRELVLDPYFTSIVGRAIARRAVSEDLLRSIQHHNPVALIAAIPFMTAYPSIHCDNVIQLSNAWIRKATGISNSMRHAALGILVNVNSTRVLDVTHGLEKCDLLDEARLRNGDATAGALALAPEFFPAYRFDWLESIIRDAQIRQGPRLVRELRSILMASQMDDSLRGGALCLAGYLGEPELEEAILCAWGKSRKKQTVFRSALWAALRCTGDSPHTLLGPIIEYATTLPREETSGNMSVRSTLLHEVSLTSRHGFADKALSYLAGLAILGKDYRLVAAALLDRVDHPIAIEFTVRRMSEATYPTWRRMWQLRWRRRNNHSGLSIRSTAALKLLWEDELNSDKVRDNSFSLWSKVVDASELSSISRESPFYERAVSERAACGDRTVTGYVQSQLQHDERWFHLIPFIWSTQFEAHLVAAVEQQFVSNSEPPVKRTLLAYYLPEILRDIPSDAAERVIHPLWNNLSTDVRFIQLALYHNSTVFRQLAASAVQSLESTVDPFHHIHMFFGLMTEGAKDHLTTYHLDGLLPYLDRLSSFTLATMFDWCHRHGHKKWANDFLEAEMRRRASQSNSDAADGERYVARMLEDWAPTQEELLRLLERYYHRSGQEGLLQWWDRHIERNAASADAARLLIIWYQRSGSAEQFNAILSLIGSRGTRSDLQTIIASGEDTADDPGVINVIAGAEFAVKYRILQ